MIIMIIFAHYSNMISYYYIVPYNAVGFDRRIFTYIEIISNDNFISSPNEYTSGTMEIFSDSIFSPDYIFIE